MVWSGGSHNGPVDYGRRGRCSFRRALRSCILAAMSFEPPQKVEMEFRDGVRLVPDYLAPALSKLETHRLTYDEALAAANKGFQTDLLNAQGDKIVSAHFRGNR